jgi:hypothetical protein
LLTYNRAEKGGAGSFAWGTAVSVGVGGIAVSVAGMIVSEGAISSKGIFGSGALQVESHNTKTKTMKAARLILFSFSLGCDEHKTLRKYESSKKQYVIASLCRRSAPPRNDKRYVC